MQYLQYPAIYLRDITCKGAKIYSARQKGSVFVCICNVWNVKFHHHSHNSVPPIPILRQIKLVYALPSYFLIIHFHIIFPSISRPPKWPPSLKFLHQNIACDDSFSPIRTIYPTHLISHDLITQKITGEKYSTPYAISKSPLFSSPS